MAQRLDWPRYSRWTWIIAILALIVLIWLWATGRGPGSVASCCDAAPVAATAALPAAPVVVPSAPVAPSAPSPVAHKAMWDGNKLTLEGQVSDAATKKAIVDAAAAKYGAANVIDRLTIDAAPAAKAEDVQCGDSVVVAATFATGKADLTADARKLLDAVVPCIKGPFEVGGHTDNVGKDDSNQALSEARAASVAQYLASKGVDAKLLTPKGYGPTQPIGDNGTTEGKAKNRRIEFKKM
jgi:outer membrane protein OmpA-like peptidoglycan-associated protein